MSAVRADNGVTDGWLLFNTKGWSARFDGAEEWSMIVRITKSFCILHSAFYIDIFPVALQRFFYYNR